LTGFLTAFFDALMLLKRTKVTLDFDMQRILREEIDLLRNEVSPQVGGVNQPNVTKSSLANN